MNIKTKIEHFAGVVYKKVAGYMVELRDVRNLGLVVFVSIILLISWSGARVIQTNYALERQVQQIRQQNDLQRIKNTNLSLQNKYYDTPQYREVTARQNYGLAKPGETVVSIPHGVAMRYTVKPLDSGHSTSSRGGSLQDAPLWQRNLTAWTDFFMHRTVSGD